MRVVEPLVQEQLKQAHREKKNVGQSLLYIPWSRAAELINRLGW